MTKLFKIFTVLVLMVILGICGTYFYYDKEKKDLDESVRKSARGKFIKLSKGFVHYELAGPESGNVVVLVHGAGSGYYAWDNNFYQLANAGYRVLRYDLYGRGLSDRPMVKYDLNLFNQQLDELVDSLKLTKPYNLVSVSMGAMVAIDQVNKNPERIKKVVLVDPAAIGNGDKHWTLKTPVLSDLLMTIYWAPRAVDKQMAEFFNPSKVAEYRNKSEVHLEYKGLRRAMLSTWINTCTLSMNKELKMMGDKKKDILLLWGEKDPLTPLSLSKKYRQEVPHIKFIKISNAGHLSNYERPDTVNSILINYLR